jgi:hypothetical protein
VHRDGDADAAGIARQRRDFRPRFAFDTAVTWEMMTSYSLLLIGGPDENSVAKRFADQLPLQLHPSSITIGSRDFPVSGAAAVQLTYPSPADRDRYVVVLAANSPQGMKNADAIIKDQGFCNSLDYCIVDGKSYPWVAGGYFDTGWQLRDEYIEWGKK